MEEKKHNEGNVLTDTQEELELANVEKKLNEFIMKYQMDIETLNRILSTYEDKLSVLEGQYHDLSFKYKQLQVNLEPKQ